MERLKKEAQIAEILISVFAIAILLICVATGMLTTRIIVVSSMLIIMGAIIRPLIMSGFFEKD